MEVVHYLTEVHSTLFNGGIYIVHYLMEVVHYLTEVHSTLFNGGSTLFNGGT